MREKLTARPHWFHEQMLETIERLLLRPESRRGPFIITDHHLRNVRVALKEASSHAD